MKHRLLRYIILGTIGYGLGGALWEFLYPFPLRESVFGWLNEAMHTWLGGLIFGAIGGGFLAILYRGNKWRLIIFSAVGYAFMGILLFHSLFKVLALLLPFAIAIYAARILVGGLFIGWAVRRIKLFLLFGFLGYLFGWFLLDLPQHIIGLGLGIGLFLGIGMYLAERKQVSEKQ